ncbi:MAG: DNA polymerase III subunit delta, partial [Candidatus Margulisbacteria bacterium]|nr:DNA polymerase III subunit delta [Candidatus Margulisiibacteriota bacterium]
VDLKHKEWDKVVPHLKDLPAGTKVVFWADKVDKRSKLYKALDKLGEVSEFQAFAEWEQDKVVDWITRQVKGLNKEIDRTAAEDLQQICGNSLRKLSSEIEKLITYIGDTKTIRREDVAALASPGDINTFALANSIIDKDLKQSLKFFRILYKNKADLFGLLGLLATQYRTILQVKSVPRSVNNPFKVAQTIGANPYFVKKCLAKSGKFKVPELVADLELILQTGLKLKSGEDQLTTFELLLSSLCGN